MAGKVEITEVWSSFDQEKSWNEVDWVQKKIWEAVLRNWKIEKSWYWRS